MRRRHDGQARPKSTTLLRPSSTCDRSALQLRRLPGRLRGTRMRGALALRGALLAAAAAAAHAQAAAQVGARPPKAVVTALCSIGDVFGKLTEIKTDADCAAGCAGGTGMCPAEWYPSAADTCSPECGQVFEPFCELPLLSLLSPLLRAAQCFFASPLRPLRVYRGSVRVHAHQRAHGRHGRDGPVL